MAHSYGLYIKPDPEVQIQISPTMNLGYLFHGLLKNLFGIHALCKCQDSYQAQSPFSQKQCFHILLASIGQAKCHCSRSELDVLYCICVHQKWNLICLYIKGQMFQSFWIKTAYCLPCSTQSGNHFTSCCMLWLVFMWITF